MVYSNRIKSKLILIESDITNRSAIVNSRVDNGSFAMTHNPYVTHNPQPMWPVRRPVIQDT